MSSWTQELLRDAASSSEPFAPPAMGLQLQRGEWAGPPGPHSHASRLFIQRTFMEGPLGTREDLYTGVVSSPLELMV